MSCVAVGGMDGAREAGGVWLPGEAWKMCEEF